MRCLFSRAGLCWNENCPLSCLSTKNENEYLFCFLLRVLENRKEVSCSCCFLFFCEGLKDSFNFLESFWMRWEIW